MLTRRSALTRSALAFGLAATASLALAPAAFAQKLFFGSVKGVAVSGYDPVAYFTEGKPVKGNPAIKVTHAGADWYFASAANQQAFSLAPDKYMPQYGGHCAWAAAQKYLAPGDPSAWKIVDGKLYLNANLSVQKTWEKDIPGFIKTGDANWPALGAK